MLLLVVAMLVILVLAGLIVLYVAFPHRGEDVPHVPWVGHLLRRGVDNAPTLDNTEPDDDDVDRDWLHLDLTRPDHGRAEGRRRA